MRYKQLYHNKRFKVKDDIYMHEMIITIGDYSYFSTYMQKRKIELREDYSKVLGFSLVDKNYGSFIWIPSWEWTIEDHCVLGHELIHTTLNVLRSIGFVLDYNNPEPINYYYEYLLRKSLRALTKLLHKKD